MKSPSVVTAQLSKAYPSPWRTSRSGRSGLEYWPTVLRSDATADDGAGSGHSRSTSTSSRSAEPPCAASITHSRVGRPRGTTTGTPSTRTSRCPRTRRSARLTQAQLYGRRLTTAPDCCYRSVIGPPYGPPSTERADEGVRHGSTMRVVGPNSLCTVEGGPHEERAEFFWLRGRVTAVRLRWYWSLSGPHARGAGGCPTLLGERSTR